jgi:O-antigen/teichoic acid export membrane protein
VTSLTVVDRSFERGASWLTLSTTAVGILNFGYVLGLTWLLPAHAYSIFASGQALLLLCATVAGASVPWVLAQGVAMARDDLVMRRHLLLFAGRLAGGQGLVAAVAVVLVAGQFATGLALAMLALAAGFLFFAAVTDGYLQGVERFNIIAGLRIGEVLVKVGVGIPLALTGMGVAGALAGIAVGALMVVVGGVPLMRDDLGRHTPCGQYPGLWRHAIWLTALQAGVALFANLDVLLASILAGPSPELARYQASTALGRVPLLLALALAAVVFPRISAGRTSSAAVLRAASDFFVRTTLPVALVIATMPSGLVAYMLPSEYAGAAALLPYTAASGLAISALYLLIAAYQAEQRFRAGAHLLGIALCIHGVAITAGLALGGVQGVAVGTVVGSSSTVILTFICSTRIWPLAFRPRWSAVVSLVPAVLLVAFHQAVPAWSACATVALAGAGWTVLGPHLVGRAPLPTINGIGKLPADNHDPG